MTAKNFARGDVCRLLRDYTIKLGDGLFHGFKRGTAILIIRKSTTAIDNYDVRLYPNTRGDTFPIRYDYLRKCSPLELLAMQAPE